MRRIAIAAAKGGTGKTTTAVTLAHGLALSGLRVLLIDCDPRRDAALHFGVAPRAGLAQWLQGREAEAIEVRHGLRLLDSGGDALAAMEAELLRPATGARLRSALETLENVDVVVLDCPAGFGAWTRVAIAACDEVVMPLGADYLSLASAAGAIRQLQALATADRPARVLGILPTFHDPKAASGREVEAVLAELHRDRVFQTRIEIADALREAPAARGTIFDSEPLSRAAGQYAAFVEAVRNRAPSPSSTPSMD